MSVCPGKARSCLAPALGAWCPCVLGARCPSVWGQPPLPSLAVGTEPLPPPRYDIKGCSVDRWAEPASAVVLKDLNFEGKSLVLGKAWGARGGDTATHGGGAEAAPRAAGSQRPWLLRQLELDSRFLEELRVLDYSLLLAVRPPLPDGFTAR